MATLRKSAVKPAVKSAVKKPRLVKSPPTARLIMTADPETVLEEASLFEAAAKMAELGVRHLPVVDSLGKLVGMLSDRDLRSAIGDPVIALRGRHDDSESCVGDVMAQDPVRAALHTSVAEIAEMLVDERIGAVPIVDEGDRPVGIVSYVDLIRFLAGTH